MDTVIFLAVIGFLLAVVAGYLFREHEGGGISGVIVFVFAGIFLIASGLRLREYASTEILAEGYHLEVNDIYELVSGSQVDSASYLANIKDREGHIRTYRLPSVPPQIFKVVENEDGKRSYEPYPPPKAESQPAEPQ